MQSDEKRTPDDKNDNKMQHEVFENNENEDDVLEQPEKLPENLISQPNQKAAYNYTLITPEKFEENKADEAIAKAQESSEKPLSSMEKSTDDKINFYKQHNTKVKSKKLIKNKSSSRNYEIATISSTRKNPNSRNLNRSVQDKALISKNRPNSSEKAE